MKSFILLAISASILAGCAQSVAPRPNTQAASQSAGRYDPAELDRLIAFHEERVKKDPQGAIGLAMLGEHYLQAARERDDINLAEKAELAALASLKARESRNERAAVLLANALLEHHEFPEALAAIDKALKIDSENPTALRMRADILMELGQYDKARKAVAKISELDENPSALVVVGRWHELNGDTEATLASLRTAVKIVDSNASVSAPIAAYFHTRLGESLWKAGFDEEAIKTFMKARSIYDGDYKAAADLARAYAVKKDWDNVIKWATETAKVASMTDVIGLHAHALKETGRPEEAQALITKLDKDSRLGEHLHELQHGHSHAAGHDHEKHTHDRLYASLLADQGRHLDVAMHLAKEDLDKRPDIYAWDCYAWTLFKAGKVVEAKKAMKEALKLGTKDRHLTDHAKAMGL